MIIQKMKLSMAVVTLAGSVLMTTPVAAAGSNTKEKKTETKQSLEKYKNKAVADIYSTTTLNIRKKKSINSEVVGKLKKGNIVTVLEKGAEWSKIESGNAAGYVYNQYLKFGDDVETFAKNNQIQRVAKVSVETLRVREKPSTESDIVTLLSEGETYQVKNASDGWAKVSANGKTGYISTDYAKIRYSFGKAKTMKEIQEAQQKKKEKEAAREAARKAAQNKKVKTVKTVASSSVKKEEINTSSSSSKTTQRSSAASGSASASSISGATIGQKVANYAQQFVGNPYRYGGNSLTGGIDCSGFTQQVLAKFGYSISRTSSSQATEGIRVSTSNLRAGDLLFYGDGGGINHVAIYIGGGQVVHASNSAPYPKGGIKISSAFYRTPVCARRIIQ